MLELPLLTHTDMHGHIIVYAFTHTHVLAEYTFAVGIFPSPDNCRGLSDLLFKFCEHAYSYLMQKLINCMLMDQSCCLG
jgi:hypothetical protein